MDINARGVRPVIDPALAPRTQWWLGRLIRRRAQPADRLAIEFIGPLTLVICLIAALTTGLGASWLCAATLAAIGTLALRHEIASGALHRHRGHYVDPSELDTACWRPLHAAQRAIEAVLRSQVYRDGLLDHAARAADLRRHQWEIAVRLRDIATLRADYTRSMSAGVPGPQTAAVLSAHLRAITIAEITYLTEQAIRTRDAFQVTLHQAALAAQPLVFPDAERTREAEVIAG